jgi:AcrR family transcriptional regulator
MAAATTLFIQNGIKATSISEIAKAANVSQVTLYKYFDSKERLGEEVALALYAQALQGYGTLFADQTIPFPKQLRNMLVTDMNLDSSINEDFYNFMLTAFQNVDKQSPTGKAYQELQDDFWDKLITRGRETGYFNKSISDKAIRVFIDMFVQYAQDANNNALGEEPGKKYHDITAELIELFFFGMLKTDPALHDEVMGYLNEV